MIDIPFGRLELLMALSELGGPDSEKMAGIGLKVNLIGVELLPADRALKNIKIATWHGISLEVLINSPNYAILCEEYTEYGIRTWIDRMQKEVGLTEPQAWAIVAGIRGMLD